MDRIWGGFMNEIKEEDENGTPLPPASPDTKARQALNDKTKRRRRRRARVPVNTETIKQESKSIFLEKAIEHIHRT